MFPLLMGISLLNTNLNINKKNKGNIFNLFVHVPVKKKYIFNINFMILLFVAIPGFIITIYLSIMNIFVSPTEMIAAYSGFSIIVFSFSFISMALFTGISSLNNNKFKFAKIIPFILVVLYLIPANYNNHSPIMLSSTKVTADNMFLAFGTKIEPYFEACKYFGGGQGLLILILSLLPAYYFCCRLPLKISEKVG
jgi:hypothetical protein